MERDVRIGVQSKTRKYNVQNKYYSLKQKIIKYHSIIFERKLLFKTTIDQISNHLPLYPSYSIMGVVVALANNGGYALYAIPIFLFFIVCTITEPLKHRSTNYIFRLSDIVYTNISSIHWRSIQGPFSQNSREYMLHTMHGKETCIWTCIGVTRNMVSIVVETFD
jgi:hypothetical protein